MNRPKFYVYLPIVFALILILGIFIGSTFNSNNKLGSISFKGNNQFSKIDEILRYIQQEYVDTVNEAQLIDKTIVGMLQHLDPHSSYITADELQASNEPLQGNFEGVGIEFNIVNDTICVVAAIPGGPAENVGVQAGDKIIKVNGEKVAGIKISNKGVMEKLKGKGGTKVKVGILRRKKKDLVDFTITRSTIPIYSVDVAYMVAPTIGYIKISRFAATTYDEYITAFNKLTTKGMKGLILDLRGNGGGFLNTAVDIADEFLMEGEDIVYTEGKARSRKDYKATNKGKFEVGKLIVLTDDGSASASEILAGALQDNDRATIVGRRSFGKGLVQREMDFNDGSAVRLTIARYYTPTGRSIQKPYSKGNEDYFKESDFRFLHGELYKKDSIKVIDSLKFKTKKGKIVYGGGGIVPDVFVPLEAEHGAENVSYLLQSGIVGHFVFEQLDKDRDGFSKLTFEQFLNKINVTDLYFDDFQKYLTQNGLLVKLDHYKALVKRYVNAEFARQLYGDKYYYEMVLKEDAMVKAVLKGSVK